MNTTEIIELTQQYIMNTYTRFPVAFVRGEGCYLFDAEGKQYLDFVAGIAVNALGHSHPAIVESICEQAKKLIHTSNLFHIQSQSELAHLLCENSFADKVFFCNSGAEANEAAVKLARRYGKINKGEDCYEVITAEKSFHGRTLKMIAATGQERIKRGFEPLPQGFLHVPLNNLDALYQAISEKTCAIMLEPIQGEGGLHRSEKEYLLKVRELCDKHQILLIFDEIQCGMGRTGKLFAYEHSQIPPDILTLAKALGTGIPIGACLATDRAAQAFQPGDHGSTFGGNFLACQVAKTFLEILIRPNFLAEVVKNAKYLHGQLIQLKSQYELIQEIRGEGLMIGIELNIEAKTIVEKALQKGLIINCVQNNVLRLVPPLVVTKEQIDEAIQIMASLFQESLQGKIP